MSAAATHAATEAQEEAIKAAIAESQPLIGPLEPISVLREEYAANPRFHPKIESLDSRAVSIRRARGDGNCFYRSYCFAIMEWAQRTFGDSAASVRVRVILLAPPISLSPSHPDALDRPCSHSPPPRRRKRQRPTMLFSPLCVAPPPL